MAKADVSIGKLSSDCTKLLIENKCVVDRLLNEGVQMEKAIVPCLQIYGPKATLYSVKLVANELYVGLEEGRCSLGQNGISINDFRHVYNLLQTLKGSVLNIINLCSEDKEGSTQQHEQRETRTPPNNYNKISPLSEYLLR